MYIIPTAFDRDNVQCGLFVAMKDMFKLRNLHPTKSNYYCRLPLSNPCSWFQFHSDSFITSFGHDALV